MSENPLDQRDLDSINKQFDAVIEALHEIRAQTTRTNGRVTQLERTNIYIRGFIAALGFVISVPAIIGTVVGAIIAIQRFF